MNKAERARNSARRSQFARKDQLDFGDTKRVKSVFNGCSGKIQFHSERMAGLAIQNREAQEPGLRLRTYKCSECNHLHLTSQLPGQRK